MKELDLSKTLILIDGIPRTQDIDSIEEMARGSYSVRFRRKTKTYKYGVGRIGCLTHPESVSPENCRIYRNGLLQEDIATIQRYESQKEIYWRITYLNGYTHEYHDGEIHVAISCLDHKEARSVMDYLREVAKMNPLRIADQEDDTGEEASQDETLLAKFYEDITFVDNDTVAASYLTLEDWKDYPRPVHDIIFPFGCNESQRHATEEALARQVSVIQGPPGTGKTQTILNILANIVRNNQTALVVSNNNSATANILEKMDACGLAFIVAPLGKKENKETFLRNQPPLPTTIVSWQLSPSQRAEAQQKLSMVQQELAEVYTLQNRKAQLTQELADVSLEWKHFIETHHVDPNTLPHGAHTSSRLITLWLKFQDLSFNATYPASTFARRLKNRLELLIMRLHFHFILRLHSPWDVLSPEATILELQSLYYLNRQRELHSAFQEVDESLSLHDVDRLTSSLREKSMLLLRDALSERYAKGRKKITDLRVVGDDFLHDYPIVLSTTFSARTCLFGDKLYDYLIMDEASQVSIETGALSLTCARRAVIVGDSLQLPNVVRDEDKPPLNALKQSYDVSDAYNCASMSFLSSVCEVFRGVSQTLLREHYRCHPRIINFCNQKFYDGQLLIMTQDHDEENVLMAKLTARGIHTAGRLNQTEVEVVKKEILPFVKDMGSIGIVTPYNKQVENFKKNLPEVDASTVHKFQGREMDVVIMSTVDDQIGPFVDNPNLLNVAISRAKKKFCLVLTGNPQEKMGNITDLLDYINYNNFSITESTITSIFSYLYSKIPDSYVQSIEKISEFDSENITYDKLKTILASEREFQCLEIVFEYPLNMLFKKSLTEADTSSTNPPLLNEEEMKYASHPHTHVDFLIVNRASHRPVLGIEVDGYAYHNETTRQHQRDLLKDSIFEKHHLPLLRLSTRGCSEEEKILSLLQSLIRV